MHKFWYNITCDLLHSQKVKHGHMTTSNDRNMNLESLQSIRFTFLECLHWSLQFIRAQSILFRHEHALTQAPAHEHTVMTYLSSESVNFWTKLFPANISPLYHESKYHCGFQGTGEKKYVKMFTSSVWKVVQYCK